MTRVINKYKEDYDVYIGRGSLWGNPFVIGKDGDRDTVIDKYRDYLKEEIRAGRITKEDLQSLEGKRLGCFCKPRRCHGDVIIKAIEWSLK